jgi:hypothetical protein
VKPGERVRVISETAELLAERQWSQIQLIFRQFGVETYEPSDFDDVTNVQYCYNRVEKASDEMLSELHSFLLGEDSAPSRSGPTDGIWGEGVAKVFISHIHQERIFAGELKRVLNGRYNLAAFVAHDDVKPSRVWRDSIKLALSSCDFFVALLHPGFHRSQWCDQEVGWALARDIPIFPIRPAPPESRSTEDGFLEEHQDVCLTSAPSGREEAWSADQIFISLLTSPKTHPLGMSALAEALVNSYSYDTTRRLWSLIDRYRSDVNNDQLRRMEYAVQTNRQVYEAASGPPWNRPVPSLITDLVSEREPPSPFDREPF